MAHARHEDGWHTSHALWRPQGWRPASCGCGASADAQRERLRSGLLAGKLATLGLGRPREADLPACREGAQRAATTSGRAGKQGAGDRGMSSAVVALHQHAFPCRAAYPEA